MFILVDWVIGYGLKQGADWVKGNVLFRKDLVDALSDVAEKWNEELPKAYRILDPEKLFKPIKNQDLAVLPHLQ